MPKAASRARASDVGRLLQHWRGQRRKSQLALALDAGISPRHLSFVETGRSSPSREMVLKLASALDVPLRERNGLLLAAGYAPVFRRTDLEAPEMQAARRALDRILEKQEPYPAVVMDRHWNLMRANRAGEGFFGLFLDLAGEPAPNILRLIFHPEKLRPWVANWEEVAQALIQRAHREAVGGVPDEETRRLLEEILSYPGVPGSWRLPDLSVMPVPLLAVHFRKGDLVFDYFSTVTTLGTPQDVTLQELRIECFFPADPATEERALALAGLRA